MHRDKLAKRKPLFAVECLPKLTHVVGMTATFVVGEVGVEVTAFHEERQRVVDSLDGTSRKRGAARADSAVTIHIGTRSVEEGCVLV